MQPWYPANKGQSLRPLDYPKLRWPIDIRIEQIDDQQILVLRCPVGVSPGPLGLPPAFGAVLSTFEGNTSREGILAQFSDRGLTSQLLDELIQLLEDNYFLATPKFFAEERRIKDSFAESPVRPAAFAGRTYSSDRIELQREIDGYLNGYAPSSSGTMLGLMAPHIDYRRGNRCYGVTYSHFAGRPEDLIILIGTAHQFSNRLFHLTAKGFASPLGTVDCDVDFVNQLAARFGSQRAYADEFLHKTEHSLELQIPFIAKLRPAAKIVPILVGGFHKMVASGRTPNENEEYDSFVGALSECIRIAKSNGRKVVCLAGVDMAHIGRAFGDEGQLTHEIMEQTERRDREYLNAIAGQNKRALFGHIESDQDARRVCGFPTMYSLIDVHDRLGIRYSAEVIEYRQAVDYTTDCAVTFAGMSFLDS